ncbi:tetratricopeptide repeat protein [Actinoplanes derwentensis]|uniref:Tetratricopeptide repeat-containing protein n=1 Tax=Actinoplanes derwentensis TaxID=113562 RepID=A0A1H2DDK4_9ACTN|nr:tetratricopeptide repeat protein [Actinoplanes derwentensis]GID89641.1 hypothetical protein Ade03nite_85650 [Actinoplanes derwentensis]SDT80679.1 Tetratricopeptide repeat-containing protein [Actinoplanes derwentensis]
MDDAVQRLRAAVERFSAGDRDAVTDPETVTLAVRLAAGIRPGQPVGVPVLQALGHFHLARFQFLDREPDLQKAMTYYAHLHESRPDLVPESLRGLIADHTDGTRLLRIAIDEDDPEILDGAIELLTDEAADDDPAVLSNLATALIRRHLTAGSGDDLDNAVHAFTRAAALAEPGDPQRAVYLTGLTGALRERGDVDRAVQAGGEAVAAAGPETLVAALHNLGNALLDRYRHTGADPDAQQALDTLTAAAAALDGDDPPLISILNTTAVLLRARYDRHGAPADLEDAHDLLRRATGLPGDARARANTYNNYGTSHIDRFEFQGDLAVLDLAIDAFEQAADLATGTTAAADVLMNLGNARVTRYEQRGTTADLTAAIGLLEEAVQDTAPDHPVLAERLSNLGLALSSRFEETGNRLDLDAALEACRRAAELSDDHAERAAMLGNLGNVLGAVADHSGALLDLDAALTVLAEASATVPPHHPDAARHRNNLGLAWRAHFERTGRPGDLDAAIDAHRDAVARVPQTSPERPGYLSNLGVTLHCRYYATGDLGDLDEAAACFESGLAGLPPGSRDRPSMLGNLGSALTGKARQAGNRSLLDRAVTVLREASASGPDRILATSHLATALLTAGSGEPGFTEAMTALVRVAGSAAAAPALRLSAATTAGGAARQAGDLGLAVSAYRMALSLLPLLSGRRLRRADQEFHLGDQAGLAGTAAEAAIRADRPAEALELLEHGRAVMWGHQVALRGAAAVLRVRDPQAADRLEQLRDLLDADALRRPGPGMDSVLHEIRVAGRRSGLLREMGQVLAAIDVTHQDGEHRRQ